MKTKAGLTIPFDIKADTIDPNARRFSGLAATWQKDLGDDVIEKGAFKKTLQDWRRGNKVVPLLDGHDRFSVGSVLGKMIDAKEVDEGLDATFELVPDDTLAEAALKRVQGGFITGLSIGYTPVKWEDQLPDPQAKPWDRTRILKEVKLHEISLVVFPMNEGARVDANSVKSLLDAARQGGLTADQQLELKNLLGELSAAEFLALLQPAAATPTPGTAAGQQPPVKSEPEALPTGLAPDDPVRIERSARLRSLRTRGLTAA